MEEAMAGLMGMGQGGESEGASEGLPPGLESMPPEALQQLIKAMGSMGGMDGAAGGGEGAADGKPPPPPTSQLVTPEPGLCVKTQTDKEEKIFINLCHSEMIPSPPALSDAELAAAIATWDNSKYRIPMSIGEPHAELDSAKQGCTAYDAIMSTDAFKEIKERDGMREFLVELVMAQLEHKFKILLDRDYKVLEKRRKYGRLEPQRVRTTKKKIEVVNAEGGDKETEEAPPDVPRPEYTLQRDPPEGRPEYYVLEVELPKVRSSNTLTLDVNEGRLELQAHPKRFHLGLDFEWPLEYKDTGAQFDKKRHVLTVTLMVAPESNESG